MRMTMTTDTYWARVGALELEIEHADSERLSAPGGPGPGGERERVTGLLALHGGGHTGLGEDVGLMEAADYDRFAELSRSLPLAGRWTVASFASHLRTLPLFAEPPQWELMRNFRTWVFESAALDLGLRQAGTSLAALLERTPRPVTYVNSLGLGDPPSFALVEERLAAYPGTRFKIDASFLWDRALIEQLAATGAVRTVDFKGQYGMDAGTDEQMLAMYTAVIECFPEALLEDPGDIPEVIELLQPQRARVSYDAPVTTATALDETAIRCGAVNVKPSRIGGLEELFRVYARCRADGLLMYGGGMGELGVARGQIQLLASLFHPDTFNDVAPSAFNLPEPPPGIPPSPLVPRRETSGFRWE
jgi:L-alanine-DL-glutamate epimerase-like enolase superfamily enzyme